MQRSILLALTAALLALGADPVRAQQGAGGRFLGREEIRLYGLNLTVAPAEQVVPKNMATIVSAFLQAPTPPGQTISPFAPDAQVRATLRGPSFPTPLELAVAPGEAFTIPAMGVPGVHTLDDIRLISGGQVLLRGAPESARIEVIEKLLVTQVTARALTADEIRARGIVYDRSNFQAYNFTAAFAIADNPIQINFPVLLPRLAGAETPSTPGVHVPDVPVAAIPQLKTIIPDTLKLQAKLPNLQVVGFSLEVPEVRNGNLIVPPIPGIIAIPGDIGFLNQYFSVLLMVGNVAPANSNLVVSNLTAEIILPPGRRADPGDDPLAMAMTASGESPRLQTVKQPGPDGRLGTADDLATIGPGESGNAEYLVEGRREGSHVVEMRMTGTLNGLPVGPVQIRGTAMGSVLVRNPTFALTFTHPEVVTAGEAYSLDVTVTNTSDSPANFVSLNLQARDIGGAQLLGPSSQQIDSIAPGDSTTVSFDLEARVTGKVIAATLEPDPGVTGRFGLKTSVGELGVPLSPDSLVLPKEAAGLPKPLRDAAIGLLGKAWAVATAPPAAVPADLQRFSRKIVLDRAIEVAEAGLRVSLHEPLRDSAAQLALDFIGSNFPRLPQRTSDAETLAFEQTNFRGFDLLRRKSIRGDVFADAVAGLLTPQLQQVGAATFHRDVAAAISYRPGVVSVLAAAPGALPVRLAIFDPQGRTTGGTTTPSGPGAVSKVTKEIPFSDLLAFRDAAGAVTGQLALVAAPEQGSYTVRLARAPGVTEDAPFTLSLVVPTPDGAQRQIVFDGLVAGRRAVVGFPDGAPYRLVVEWVGVPTGADAAAPIDSAIADPLPSVISVVQRETADMIVCNADTLNGPHVGRVVAVLFSEEVTPESVQDKLRQEAITNYQAQFNAVVGVALQPGRRIAYLALRDPIGPLVTPRRTLTVNGATDLRGHVIAGQPIEMETTVTDAAGVVSGQVLRADGTPAPFANVRLFYRSPCFEEEEVWIGVSSKSTDAAGRYEWDYVLAGLPARVLAVDADSGDVRDVRFRVRANGQRLNVNLVFLGRGTFSGRTLGPDGRTPLRDSVVRVTSLTDQTQYGARTDASGRFTIPGVPVGSIVIDAVNTTAVAKITESDVIPFAGATTTRDLVLLDASHEPINLQRGNVSGFVLQANGSTPAVGVPVVAYYQSNSQPNIPCPRSAPECPVAVATTGEGGAFSFPGVVAGLLRLQTFNQSSFEQGEVGVALAANQTRTATIVLAGGLGTVRGIVTDPSGQPVAGAQVGGGLSLTLTGSDGRFVLTDVPVGRREIVAVSTQLAASARVTVDLLYGGHEVNATLVLDALGSVSGVVTRANGSVVAGATVYVFRQEGDLVQVAGTAVTNEEGGYRVDNVPLGDYKASAFNADFSDGNIVPAIVRFHRQVVRSDIRFRGGNGRVTGRVFADDGATPLRARVAVSGEQVVVAGGVLGVAFRRVENFRIVDTNLTTGRYSIAGLFVGPFTLRAAGAFSPDPIAVESTMPAPGQEVEVNLRLQPTSELVGTVFLPDGNPVGANTTVRFKSNSVKTVCSENSLGETTCESFPQGVQNAEVITDALGAYRFPLLNGGLYTLTVEGPGGRTAVVKGSLAAGQIGRMDVRLLARADVVVHVRAANGETPIPGARVEVSQVGAPVKELSYTANGSGDITFGGADAFNQGDFVVVATDLRNGATGRGRGRITADGQAVEVTIPLDTTSGIVFGRVVRSDGFTAVPNAEVTITNGADAVAFAVTDEDGEFREVGIPLGAIRVDVFEAATGRRGSASGQIASNGTQLELNVTQEALGVVRGRVVAAVTLQPLRNWRVTLTGVAASGRPLPPLVATTGIDGSFSFPGAGLGQFTLTAANPGQPGNGSAQGALVREGELVEIPIIATIPRQATATMTGTVVDHVGAPVGNARVEIFASGAENPVVVTADNTGVFGYGPVPLGRYGLRAFRQGSTDSGAARVDLEFDGQQAATSIVLSGLSTITGIVRQNGQPVAGARVTLTGQPSNGCGTSCSGFANDQGRFTFERVSARTFTIVGATPGDTLRGAIGDVLNPGETKEVTVTLEQTRRLTGRVLDEAGEPIGGVVGEAVIGTRHFFAESGASGVFEFAALPLGDYRLDLRDATGPGVAVRRGTIATDLLLGDVRLDEAAPRVLGVTPLPSAIAVARTQPLTLLFSEPIDRASVSTASIRLTGPAGDVALGIPAYSAGDSQIALPPSTPLQTETRYTVTVSGLRDRAGREMAAPFTSTFTTVDVTAPTILSASPAAGASGVAAASVVRIQLSEPIARAASLAAVLQVSRNGAAVPGVVDLVLGNTTLVFTPSTPLAQDATYQVHMAPATDLAGNAQTQALDYTFSTTDNTPPTITLTAAGDGTVIENGVTVITAAAGPSHDVAVVDFYVNETLVQSARSTPFQLTLRALPALGAPGSLIRVAAFAMDTSGNRSLQAATLAVAIRPDVAPTATLLAPAGGGTAANGSVLTIRVRATDAVALAQVGYRATIGQTVRTGTHVMSTAIGDTTETFELQIPTTAAPGALVRIEPTAVDTKGQSVVGEGVELRVQDAAPPSVSITGVTSGARVRAGESTTVVVSASDAGLVRTVRLTASGAATFNETRTLDPGQASVAASFTIQIPASARAPETVTLTASATDAAGNPADAAAIVLPVADTIAPTVRLQTANGRNEMTPGSPLVVVAEADDAVGVSRIELTGSGALTIAEGRTIDPATATAQATFTIQVPDTVPPGASLQLQARAIDSSQNVSAPAGLTVTASATVDVTLPASTIIDAGSTQTIQVSLGSAAGAGGVRVDLASLQPGVATITSPLQFAAGEQTRTATLTGVSGGTTAITASVQGVERARMTVTVQGGIVTGIVRDPDQQPVVGALVTVRSGGVTRTATSDQDGRYTVQGVPGPVVSARALHESSGTYGVSQQAMTPNGYLELDVVLIDAGSVQGVVRTPSGAAVGAGAQVAIFVGSATEPEQTTFTDEDGEFEFALVSVGAYRLDASDASGNRGRTTIAVGGGQQVTRDVTYLGRGTVRGVVRVGQQTVDGAALTFVSNSEFGRTSITRASGAQGEFAFTGVFIGSFTVTAERTATGEAGSASGSIASHDQIVDVEVALAPVGSLDGVVRRADDSLVAGATVTLGGRTTTTDENGHYAFAFVPAGAVTVSASVDGTREMGVASGTIVAGQPLTRDILLAPQGRLAVTVNDAQGHGVSGAAVTIVATAGALHDTLTATAGENGQVLVDHVLAGSFTVSARANGLSGTVSGALAAGETQPVSVTLQALGTITGTVFLPGGQLRASGGLVIIPSLMSAPIQSDGSYTLTNVPAGRYNLYVHDTTSLRRASARHVDVAAGESTPLNFEMVGVGTVTGRVLNGSQGVGNLQVQVQSQHAEFGHQRTATTNAAGVYTVENVVFGPILATAGSGSLRGEAEGALARSDQPLTLDIVLTNNATTLPRTLHDGNGSQFDVQMHGGLGTQSHAFHNGFLLDVIAGGTPLRFAGEGVPTIENGGREIATRQANLGGLNVTRKVFVPATGYFTRWLEVLSNPTSQPITVDVRVTTVVGPSSGTHPVTSVLATSSGDAVLDVQGATPDRWLVVDDATDADPWTTTGGVPAVAMVFDGAGAAVRAASATHTVNEASTTEKNVVRYTWGSLTIGPGQSVGLMHFGVRQSGRASAVASATRLADLPPEALMGINPDELPIIRNFVVPADGNSTMPPLPPVNGQVTGVVRAGDGTTPIASTFVHFQSASPFYNRTHRLNGTQANGVFTIQSVFTSADQIAVPTGDSFTLTARHPETAIDAPPVSATFAAGETTRTVDVVFSNTGVVRGLARRHNQALVTTGALLLEYPGRSVSRTIGAQSAYVYTGIPAGSGTLTLSHQPAGTGGTMLTGRATYTVAAGETVERDVVLEATGSVRGTVRNAAGQTASGIAVSLQRDGFLRTVTTDTGGVYAFPEAPVGPFTVNATEPSTQVRSSASITVAQDVETVVPDLTLIGFGTLTVRVVYTGGAPANGATVQLTEAARGTTRSASTVNGAVTFANVTTTGGYTVRAVHPSDTGTDIVATGTMTHGASDTVTLTLPILGTVTAHVRYPGPVQPGPVPVELMGNVTRTAVNTSAQGDVSFNDVPGNRTFTVRAYVNAGRVIYRDSTVQQVTSEGQNLGVDITLPALASLQVTVRQGDQPAVGARVAIRHAFTTAYSNPVTVNATTGLATFANTPEGAVQIRVTTAAGAILAESTATITANDHGRPVAVTIDAGVPLPRTLTDANGFAFDIQTIGTTALGTTRNEGAVVHKAYQSGVNLRLWAANAPAPFGGSPVAQLEAQGREVVIRNAANATGLELTRKVFVPATGYFARYLELLHNPTDDPITIDAEIWSNLDSEGNTAVIDQAADRWVVTDDDPGNDVWPSSDQTLAHVYASPLGRLPLPITTLPTPAGDQLSYRWNAVTVQPHQTVGLLHFAVQQATQLAGQASAQRLAQLPPEALVDLSAEEIAAVANFAVPADGVGTVPPLALAPALTVSGPIQAWNGAAANPRNTVTLRSGNPVYSREFTASPTTAAYSITGFVADSYVLEVNNQPPSPFNGWQTPRQGGAAVTAGQTAATEPVTFTGTGSITGSVVTSTGGTPSSGNLTFSLNGTTLIPLSSLTGGGFVLPIVPAGEYTMTAASNGRVTTMPVVVAPNASQTVTVRLPAQAFVRVQVRNPDRSLAASPRVTIHYDGTSQAGTATAQGEITFAGIPQGPFEVSAVENNGAGPHFGSTTGVVTDQQEGLTIDADFAMKALATVRVTALRGQQRTAGVPVYVRHAGTSGEFVWRGQTAANGELLLAATPAGPFDLRVLSTDGRVVRAQASGVVADTADGQTIDATLTLSDNPAVVTGTLFAADGQTRLHGYGVRVRLFDGETVVGDASVSDGEYRFSDVPTPESGSLRVRVNYRYASARFVEATVAVAGGQEATRHLTVPIGAVTGTVRMWDGTTPVYGDVVFDVEGEDQDQYASLDLEGRFAFFEPPPGPFMATAYIDGVYASTAGVVQSAGEVVTQPIVFGRVTGTVTWADAATVANPSVFVTQTLRPGLEVTYGPVATGADGSFEVIGPQAGPVTVTATSLMLEGVRTGALPAANPDVDLDVQLEADGVVSGTVRDAQGALVPDATVMLAIAGLNRHMQTDQQGRFEFTRVRLGPFTVQAQLGFASEAPRASATGVLAGTPATATVPLQFPATGAAVQGTVTGADGQPVVSGELFVSNRTHAGPMGAFETSANVTSGQYLVNGVPVGDIRVTAFDGLAGGWRDATLTADAPATVDVQLGSLFRLSHGSRIQSSGGFNFDVTCAGSIASGGLTSGTWAGMYAQAFRLFVDNSVEFPCVRAGAIGQNGRELTLEGGAINGLRVSRRIYTPAAGAFTRYLEVITNPGTAARTVSLSLNGGIGSWSTRPTVVTAPAATGPTFAVVNFAQMGSLGFVFAGPAAAVGATGVGFTTGPYFDYGYTVTVQPGQTVILMHFALQGIHDPAGVDTTARALVNLTKAGALDGLTAAERAQVVNFRIP